MYVNIILKFKFIVQKLNLIFNYPPLYFPLPRPTESDNYCEGYFDVRWNFAYNLVWKVRYTVNNTTCFYIIFFE